MGFGNGRRIDPGSRDDYDPFDDDEVEATRAMDLIDDDMPPPTEMVRAPVPAPPPPGRAPRQRPGQGAPSGPPPTLHDDMAHGGGGGHDEDDATRVLSTADLDNFNAGGGPTARPAPAPAIPIEMRIVSGPDRGKVHRITQGDALVGRGLDCDIVLADPAVSRKHFRIVRSGDDVDAIDMGGANGTNVNGERVSRQRLTSGDQIEVGTTVMQLHVEGAAAPKPRDFPQAGGAAAAPAAAKKGGSKVGLIIGLAAAGILVLGGGGVAAWLVMSGDDEVKEEKSDEPDISALIKDAKGLIDDQEWAEAVDTLKKARKKAPTNTDVKGMLHKAEEELEAAESLEEGEKLAKKKRYKEAIEHFKEVPNSSEQFSEAQDAIKEAKVDLANGYLKAARAAMEAGESDKAKKLIAQVLKLDPKHTEGKLLAEQLEGEGSGGDNAGDKGGDDKGGKDSKGEAAAKPSVSADKLLSKGLKAYHNRQWSAAQQAFTALTKGGYSKKDRAKAAKYLSASKDVAAAFGTAESQSNPLKQASAFRKAYAADKRVDGHFGPMLVKKLTAAYVTAAQAFYKRGRYAKASEAVREAMNYDPENAKAMKLEDQCMSKAAQLLAKAKSHMEKKNYATAQGLAREVMGVLPTMDPRSAEARDIAKKAAAASVAGDDD